MSASPATSSLSQTMRRPSTPRGSGITLTPGVCAGADASGLRARVERRDQEWQQAWRGTASGPFALV
eukprot:2771035-Alexandrium_andersonii.AAC.1